MGPHVTEIAGPRASAHGQGRGGCASHGTVYRPVMRDEPSGSDEHQRAIALSRAFEELNEVLQSLPARFPEAYGGTFGGPTNDDMTIEVVEGAAGAEELIEAVCQAERRSLDQVGVSFRFHFEPATITHARLDVVRAELAAELMNRGELFELGMRGVGLSKSCVAVSARIGTAPAVRPAVQARYPDIPLLVRESGPVRAL